MESAPPQSPPKEHVEWSIRRRLLSGLAVFLYRRPYLSLALLVATTILSLWSARNVVLDASLRAQAFTSRQEQRLWNQASLLDRGMEPIRARVVYRSRRFVPPESFWSDLRDAWDDPRYAARVDYEFVLQGARESTAWFDIIPTQDSGDIHYCLSLERFLRETVDALRDEKGESRDAFRVVFEGRHIQTARAILDMRTSVMRSFAILILCTALMLIVAFRKVESLIFIGLPPLVGLVWTLGLVGVIYSQLSLLSFFYAVMMLALGLEYSTQMYHRFTEELYREGRYYAALRIAYAETGRGMALCTLATTLIFASFRLSSFQHLRELALVGSAGTLCMAAAVLFCLPGMAAFKNHLSKGRVRVLKLSSFGMKDLSAAVIASPRTALTLGLIMTAYLAYFSQNLQINRDIGLDLEAASLLAPREEGDAELYPFPSISILIRAESLADALEANDRLYANLTSPPLALAEDEIESLSQAGPLREAMLMDGEPGGHHFGIQKKIVLVDGVYLLQTRLHPNSPESAERLADLETLRREAGDGILSAAMFFRGGVFQNRALSQRVAVNMALSVLLAGLVLLVSLMPHFHMRFEDTLLAILPLLCAALCTLGLLGVMEIPTGLYTLMIFPLLLGIALHQSVLLIQRLHERRYATLRQMLRTGGRSNLVSMMVLVICFGSLGQVSFRPLEEMALLAVVVLILSTMSTLTLVPALLQVRQEGGMGAWQSGPED